jgi:hypothetical protein
MRGKWTDAFRLDTHTATRSIKLGVALRCRVTSSWRVLTDLPACVILNCKIATSITELGQSGKITSAWLFVLQVRGQPPGVDAVHGELCSRTRGHDCRWVCVGGHKRALYTCRSARLAGSASLLFPLFRYVRHSCCTMPACGTRLSHQL